MTSIDREYAETQVRYRVLSGLWPAGEIAETVLEECFDPADVTAADQIWVEGLIEQTFDAQRKAESTWPSVTDWDRLDSVFAALNRNRVIALHHTGMTLSDGIDDITEAYHDRGGKQSDIEGYCFYHFQDVERAIDGHDLMVAFGEIAGDRVKGVEIGRRIVAELNKAGLRTSWDGNIDQRINIDGFRWQKRNAHR